MTPKVCAAADRQAQLRLCSRIPAMRAAVTGPHRSEDTDIGVVFVSLTSLASHDMRAADGWNPTLSTPVVSIVH
jgi:hypothetical protein